MLSKCAACSRPRAKAHGVLIQCTKRKCPKPRGHRVRRPARGEKEVVLLEPPPVPLRTTDPTQPVPKPTVRVLKVIRKAEVEVLCAQHNHHDPYSSLVNATPDATAQSVFKYQYWHPSGVYLPPAHCHAAAGARAPVYRRRSLPLLVENGG
ncbi:hypothetical protein DFH07DRAFT_1020375 [Mycena maculata]|uniref:Uncharacterized protein n=1 Tax=Mycena maculata TaxID=230809 RepID=A0AAD7ME55_9AGAR|nr:hypothetical protein DFH07DRAFT_1020375 [Mycena maculata]